jgi:hypothetical protein
MHTSAITPNPTNQLLKRPEMKPKKPIAFRRRLQAKMLSEKFQRWLKSKVFFIEQPDADR